LQQGLPAESFYWQVGHSVAQNNNMFHVRYRKAPPFWEGLG
jgi:hypothetical protein